MILFAVPLFLSGCKAESDVVWRQFNNVADTIQVEIAPGDPGGVVEADLTSNTGAVVIGSVGVTPAHGPVGTNHLLLIEVSDEWQDRIKRATISSAGTRGEEEYDLRQDAADPGIFDLTLTSLGQPDEMRTDSWTITLWEPIDAPAVVFEEPQ